MAFAAGWTPCVGPILGTILLYASTTGSVAKGMGLLAVYSLSLVCLFISALAINTFIATFKVITRYMRWITIVSGAFPHHGRYYDIYRLIHVPDRMVPAAWDRVECGVVMHPILIRVGSIEIRCWRHDRPCLYCRAIIGEREARRRVFHKV